MSNSGNVCFIALLLQTVAYSLGQTKNNFFILFKCEKRRTKKLTSYLFPASLHFINNLPAFLPSSTGKKINEEPSLKSYQEVDLTCFTDNNTGKLFLLVNAVLHSDFLFLNDSFVYFFFTSCSMSQSIL